jgi:hypothetical protein
MVRLLLLTPPAAAVQSNMERIARMCMRGASPRMSG